MYKHFIRALLINAAAPCRYVQREAHLEINKPSTQNKKIGVNVDYHTHKISVLCIYLTQSPYGIGYYNTQQRCSP